MERRLEFYKFYSKPLQAQSAIKRKLHEIFWPRIRLNKDFDKYASQLKVGMTQDFLSWCKRAKEGKELGSVPPRSEHKHLYIFFRKIASDVRAILIKEQNSDFI